MSDEGPSDNARRLMWALVAVVQGIVLFVAGQMVLRTLAMRDAINLLQTNVARIEERQAQYALLLQVKLDNLQRHVDRLEQEQRGKQR